jgi:autotransporter-associated beta strand protein
VSAANTTSTLGGVLSGTGRLTKAGPGTLRLSGATSNTYAGPTTVTAGTLELGKNGGASTALAVGNLVISAGTARELFSNQIGDTSSVTVNAPGALDLNSRFDIFGILTINGGSVTVGTGLVYFASVNMTGGSITATGTGEIQFRGDGTFTSDAVGGVSISGGHVQLQGVTRTFTVNDGPAATDLDLASAVQGSAAEGLTKSGAGLLLLSGSTSNTYTGPTSVNAGTLELNKLGSGTAATGALIINGGTIRSRANDEIADTSTVTVNTGGTLDLNGNSETVGALTVNGGTVKTSGAGVGRLTAASASFNSASTLAMKLVSGTGSDRLTVSGPLTVGGILQLSLGQAVAAGTAITLLDNTGIGPISGTFANLPPGSVLAVGGQAFAVSYSGGTGNDLVLTRVVPPTVTGTQINGGAAQRSMVTSLTVTFSTDVTLPANAAAAFTLQRIGGGTVTIGTALAVVVNS